MGPSAMLAVFMDDLDDNGKEQFIDNNNNHIYETEIDDFINQSKVLVEVRGKSLGILRDS